MNGDTNLVLEGKYRGERINFDSDNGLVWIGKKNKDYYGNFFYKNNVTSIEKLDAQESSASASAGLWFGVVGAIAASGIQDYLVRVKWARGGESMVKVRAAVYEYMLRNMDKLSPEKQDEKIRVVWDKESVYNNAIALFNKNTYASDQAAMKEFQSVIDYKDARIYITKLRSRIEKHKTNAPQIVAEGRKSLNTILVIVMVISAILAIVGFCVDLAIVGVLFAIIFVCVLLIFIAFANTAPKKFQNNKKKK